MKERKMERDKLVAECKEKGFRISRKNLTVKQQIDKMKKRLHG